MNLEHMLTLKDGMHTTFRIDQASVELTDQGALFITSDRHRGQHALDIFGVGPLHAEGYLYKFLKVTEQALKLVEFTNKSPNTSPVMFSPDSFTTIRLSIGLHGIDRIKKVLDEDRLSPVKKFAAIVSFLTICRQNFTFEEIMEYALAQVEPESIPNMPLWRYPIFLAPDFANPKFGPSYKVSDYECAFPPYFKELVEYFGFINTANHDETYEQYLERNSADLFKPVTTSRDFIDKPNELGREFLQFKLKQRIEHLKKREAALFVELYADQNPIYDEFFTELVKSGSALIAKLAMREELKDRNYCIVSLSYFLTVDETNRLINEIDNDSNSPFEEGEFDEIAYPLIAMYYSRRGYQSTVEMITLAKRKIWFCYKSRDVADAMNGAALDIRKFIKALDPEYHNFPIEWTMNILDIKRV